MQIKFSREPYVNKQLYVYGPDEDYNFNKFEGILVFDENGKIKEFIEPENCELSRKESVNVIE